MKNCKKLLFYLLYALCQSCIPSDEKVDKNVLIEVILPKDDFRNKNGKMFYLVDESKHEAIDSTLSKDGILRFRIFQSKQRGPFLSTIIFKDSNQAGNIFRKLGFENPWKPRNIYSSFYLDTEDTRIDCFSEKDTISNFYGSHQNEPYFKQLFLRYPEVGEGRSRIIDQNRNLILQFSSSVFFLEQLYRYKHHFRSQELKLMLSAFSSKVGYLKLYNSFQDYFDLENAFDRNMPYGVKLSNIEGLEETITKTEASFRLIVFWASWCGPCRKEIPELKKVYKKYRSQGLDITSISIDRTEDDWIKAMDEENMPWKQLIAVSAGRKEIEMRLDISSIPKAYLFDKNDSLVAKFTGSDSNIEAKLDSLFRN
jgi:thiol-disulfide isomerase/thioredoxin